MSGASDDELDMQAAEYVLGLLPPNQARALEALAMSDAAVAARIAAWERRLAPLAEALPPSPPPPLLWRRLALATGIDSVIQPPVPPRRSAGRANWWKLSTLAASAVAACLAFLLYTVPPQRTEQFAALTANGAPGATYLVRVAADGRATVVAIGDTNLPQGRSLELWALRSGSTVPVSMGLMPPAGRADLVLPLSEGTKLLVSQEPQGGSPTKLPTGPVVFAGQLTGL